MISRFVCLIVGHRTALVYTDTEGHVQCRCCQTVFERWPILRPEKQNRGRAEREAFWARVDEAKATPVQPLRRVR